KNKTYQQKAFQEAKTKFENKMREGYKYDNGHSTVEIPQPMLANKYKPPTDKSKGNITHFPVAAQVKFDGIRNIVYIDKDDQAIMLTRKMNKRAHFNDVREECKRLLQFLPSGTILDGELYSGDVKFETIASIGAKELAKHPEEHKLSYYMFDIFHPKTIWTKDSKNLMPGIADDGIYVKASGYPAEDYTEIDHYIELRDSMLASDQCRPVEDIADVPLWVLEVRLKLMGNAFGCYKEKYGEFPHFVKLTKTYIIKSREEIFKAFTEFKNMDQEGAMIRHFARGNTTPEKSLYRPGRSDNLLKVKDIMTTEVKITGVTSGKGKFKELAMFIYEEVDTGHRGTFVPAGSFETRAHFLKHPEEAIGKYYTVKFQNRTKDGKLRFPIGIGFREE